MAAVSVGKLL